MTVFNTKIFNNKSGGSSLIEVILAISIVAIAAPFMYKQMQRTYSDIENISMAQKIVGLQDPVLNFVRSNQENWPSEAEIMLTPDDIKEISPMISTGIIDKREYRGSSMTDVYLALDISDSAVRTNQIARQIGTNAAVVGDDGIAYADTWAVSAPDFKPGNLIYRISHNFAIQDRNNFLHRAASDTVSIKGDNNTLDNLNAMLRDLNMGGKDILNVGTISAQSVTSKDVSATFIKAQDAYADSVYFSSGANVQGNNATIDTIRALGDISGFKSITADNLNGNSFSNVGEIITDRAVITNSIKIGNLFKLKAATSRSVDSFTAIASNSIYVPYVATDNMIFYPGFGLTVSGELLMSGTAPLKIGNWTFPSNQMPQFSSFTLGRAKISETPNKSEFSAIMSSDWQTKKSIEK